ncbi:hypothetical protein O6H91_07G015800 [Diphasiastrum complanatum]|uniref:Uncharacterized protein n=1 Tax=Diphasiastrum complanatum TaxID=34168 RepID=A0ACC2D2N6_DIPCM|nr:hypothetical protein O6H91_Y170300 [Diphasiastrum complanatum]KAJ7548539.1 hypothetical protein O6H91_07G015800 [Diphasiastrum complanatum]
MEIRARALGLYRSLLRSARTWPGPPSEKTYILEESRLLFRKYQHLSDPTEINQKLFEGETRFEIAWHYKIPYPRLHNLATGSVAEKPSKVVGPSYEVPQNYNAEDLHGSKSQAMICGFSTQV